MTWAWAVVLAPVAAGLYCAGVPMALACLLTVAALVLVLRSRRRH